MGIFFGGQNRPNLNFYFLKIVESYHKNFLSQPLSKAGMMMNALAVQSKNSSGFYGGKEKQNGNVDNVLINDISVRIWVREIKCDIIQNHKQNPQEGTETDKQTKD